MKDLESIDKAIESYSRLAKSASRKSEQDHYRQRELWLKELEELRCKNGKKRANDKSIDK